MNAIFFNRFPIVLLLVLGFGLILSCKTAKKNNTFTIGFSQCTGNDLWRRNMLAEMLTELSLHPEVDFHYLEAGGNSETQRAQVDTLIDKEIDLLVISPNEAEPLTATVKKVMDRGIPVIVIDREIKGRDYTAFIGSDNVEIGEMAGQYLSQLIGDKGRVIEIMGLLGSSPAIDRGKGFAKAINRSKGLTIAKTVYGDWMEDTTKNMLSDMHRQLASIDAIFAHNDNMALGARKILHKYYPEKHIPIIGVDACFGEGGGLDMVYDGKITASLIYPTFGKEAIRTALDILRGQPFKKENKLSSIVIDSTNVRVMKMQAAMISSQKDDIYSQRKLLDEQKIVYKSQQAVLNAIIVLLVLSLIFGSIVVILLRDNRKINKNLAKKNLEIDTQRKQLIEMSKQAAAGTEARLNFFTNITHELRTPLTLILSPIEDMAKDTRLLSLAGDKIKAVQRNSVRLLNIVNQLLDFRKIEIEGYVIQASPNNLVSFIRDLMEPFKIYALKRQVQLSFVPAEKEISVWFDLNMLDKALLNLLSNAFKFVNAGGFIKVYVERMGSDVSIKIKDSGIGMHEKDITLIFDPYYQADNAPANGFGIGLSLAKEIITKHKGQIQVESKKGLGSTFIVILPLGSQHLSDREKLTLHNPSPQRAEKTSIQEIYSDTEIQEMEQSEQWGVKEHSLLIVEDNPDLLNYLVTELSDKYDVFFTSSGPEAIRLAREKVPDLIITDNVIPELSGKEVCRTLKSDFKTSHIPIILLTAQASSEQVISGMDALVDMYITKPFLIKNLSASIRALIHNRKVLKTHFTSAIELPTESVKLSAMDRKLLNDFSSVVEENLSNDRFCVEDICRLIGISRMHLYRKIRSLTGMTVNEYLLERRLKKASYLLQHESLNVAEITYAVGFSSPSYFSTTFKAKFGYSPSQYKSKIK
ncbi:substrate-binding domain-containing protein [Olivibacter sp. XZL3]|uniref:substrate-binding domain-containing protein n=1 Tax=Olivibacter sp. XZL3 TaxID=1735116 RepID=UPI001064B057|nr:substrate-binding domain-containing protein [Olivibacter sp. XZL3]